MTEYRAIGAAGELAFATKLPGYIVPVEISPGHEYMIHRHGFLCATSQVQIGVAFQQSLGAGIFGGDGSCCKGSVDRAPHGWNSLENSWCAIFSLVKPCGSIPVMWELFKPASRSRSRPCPASKI